MEFCWVNGRYIFRNDYINRIFFCNILMLFCVYICEGIQYICLEV